MFSNLGRHKIFNMRFLTKKVLFELYHLELYDVDGQGPIKGTTSQLQTVFMLPVAGNFRFNFP